jgi:hypothetical protein
VHFGNIENTLELDMDKINNVNLKRVYNFVRAVIVGWWIQVINATSPLLLIALTNTSFGDK